MKDHFDGKRILVTGGTGLIGQPLVSLLLERGARVRVAALDDPSRCPSGAEFLKLDLTEGKNCLEACEGMEIVFHLAGIKGSPKMTQTRPASFFVPTILFNTHMMEAARRQGVARYLFTSTLGVYSPAEVFHEDDVWKSFPSPNDWFAGWAKRMGELQADAYRKEHGWRGIQIVRPANVYGPGDNFDPENAMVVPSLIRRALSGENPFVAWGDGSPVRDFIHARDVAQGMLEVFENGTEEPINLGSGSGTTIRELTEVILDALPERPELLWDTSKPSGDARRVMDISRARALGIKPKIDIKTGVRETIEWYRKNAKQADKRYNIFRETR